MQIEKGREISSQTGSKAEKQTSRQTDRQTDTDRQVDRQTGKQKYRRKQDKILQRGRQKQPEANRETGRHIQIEKLT